jgi:ribosomal protein L11 methyltransferase
LARAWPALDIHVPGCDPQLQELVLAELDDYHPTAIQEPDGQPQLRAFFQTSQARDAAARALGEAFGTHLFVERIEVDDEDWAARSQASLRAVTVGRITVAPPWEKRSTAPFSEESREKGAVLLFSGAPLWVVIQPSMGFGTGHHATTRLMLAALQRLDVRDTTVLDVGCGSGVLAIAAVLLGARSAVGVDNDPDALTSAAENVDLNAVADRVRLMNEDLRHLGSPADIVLANLTGGMLERHAPALAALTAPAGHLIVSGVMESESTVIPALERFLTLDRVEHEDEWLSATFSR